MCHGDVHPGNVMMTEAGPLLIDFDLLIDTGMISPGDVELFHYVESAEEAWAHLEREYGFDQPITQTGDLALDI